MTNHKSTFPQKGEKDYEAKTVSPRIYAAFDKNAPYRQELPIGGIYWVL